MMLGVVASAQSQSLFHIRDCLMEVKRRTKIIVSLGPATDNAKVMAALVQEGIDVARINTVSYTHLTLPTKRIV